MCWWHLGNLCVWGYGKNTSTFKALSTEEKAYVRLHIEGLHGCVEQTLFPALWAATKDTLLSGASDALVAYVHYFEVQWINGRFKNWQRFSMPNGFSVTNNPVETFNRFRLS